MSSAILLVRCVDSQGIVAKLTQFVAGHGGNIVDLQQHSDVSSGLFFMRLEWALGGFGLAQDVISDSVAREVSGFKDCQFDVFFSESKSRVAIFCSQTAHCLYDLLMRHRLGEFAGEVVCVVSNHDDHAGIAEYFGLPFFCVPVSDDNKVEAERKQQDILVEHDVNTVVLARYMQVLSAEFVAQWDGQIINIHHSFLPAFSGAKPYHQARERGVKVIGATAHYVTAQLDDGPIIAQDVTQVGHRDCIESMMQKGRDIERQVLARAVGLHLDRRVLVNGNQTVVLA